MQEISGVLKSIYVVEGTMALRISHCSKTAEVDEIQHKMLKKPDKVKVLYVT